ncbi:sensor histidine kinase [Amorphus coralli]|uniref:sensor histidine kinase n=1 Tax=Amorphus coralli TaxID=340680 RepID=UPI000376961B|nr:PAS domain-containing sensor histidine kinase [Amorphus coralli]
MNEAFETFLRLCTHAEIGGATREVRPIVVVDPAREKVVWANASGARLCDHATAWEMVTTPSRRAARLARDLARHVALRGPEQRSTLVRIRIGTEILVLQCLVHAIDAGEHGEPVAFTLVAAPASLSLRARDPLAAFARFVGGDGASVVDASGALVARSGSDWYPRQAGGRSIALGNLGLYLRLTEPPSAWAGAPEPVPTMTEAGGVSRQNWPAATGTSAPRTPKDTPEETMADIRPPLDAVHLSRCQAPAATDLGAKAVDTPTFDTMETIELRARADGEDQAEEPTTMDDENDVARTGEAEPAAAETPAARPIRFTWQTDGDDRLTYLSPEFGGVFGETERLLGLPWKDLSSTYDLDPEGAFAFALSERAAWSGTTIYWPSARHGGRVPIDLAGLAIESRDREFVGFRGFGLIRTGDTVAEAVKEPTALPAAPRLSAVEASSPAHPAPPLRADPPTNVVRMPGRDGPAMDNRHLSRPEREAFRLIAAALGARYEGDDDEPAAYRPAEPAPLHTVPARGAVAPEPAPPSRPATAPAPLTRSRSWQRRSDADPMPSAFAGPERPQPDTRLLDRLPVALLVSQHDRLVHANKAALKLLGHRTLSALIRAGGLTAVFADDEDEPDAPEGTVHLGHADGHAIPAEVRLHSVPWGDERALLVLLRASPAGESPREDRAMSDETDTGPGRDASVPDTGNTAGDAPSGEAPAVASVLDAIPDAVFVLDADRRILIANGGAEAIFNRTASAFRGMRLDHLLAEEDSAAVQALFADLAVGHDASRPLVLDEVVGLCRERGRVPLALSLGRVGDTERACVVLRDVGRWKTAEARFSEATRAAEAANAQKSEMLARISHEIRTPLNAILGFADVMLAEKLGPLGNDRYRDYLRDISISGHHILSLVNDLLDLSKIEAGKLDLSFEPVSINDVARDCANIMEPQAHTERVAIRTRLQADLPRILADSRSLRQITLNLLSNAIKFNRSGGEVSLATFADEAGAVILRVSDTGPGMSADDLQAAMEPFRRVGQTDKSGTGLGLPLTKALAEANRATFQIRSEPGQGTVVDIVFPAPRVIAA